MPSTAPALDLHNSARLENLIRDGKLYISLQDAIALALENNLDLASFRYNFPIAPDRYPAHQSRQSGQRCQCQRCAVHPGWFQRRVRAAAVGTSGGSAAAGSRRHRHFYPRRGSVRFLPSTPLSRFSGFVDHSVTQEVNAFNVGTPIFKQNNIEVLSSYSQSFPLGTNVSRPVPGPAPHQQQPLLRCQS